MKRYFVRIEPKDVPSSEPFFSPVTLEFQEPLSFRELSRLRSLLQDRTQDRFEQKLRHALNCMKKEFALQGEIVDFSVSAKILV